jgi:hypothetical protein
MKMQVFNEYFYVYDSATRYSSSTQLRFKSSNSLFHLKICTIHEAKTCMALPNA